MSVQAAARAAERRAQDNVWCPCGDHGTALDYTDGEVIAANPQSITASTSARTPTGSLLPTHGQTATNSNSQSGRERHSVGQIDQQRSHSNNNPSSSSASAGLAIAATVQASAGSRTHGQSQAVASANDFVDLTLDDTDLAPGQASADSQAKKRARHQALRCTAVEHGPQTQAGHATAAGNMPSSLSLQGPAQKQWTCSTCTLLNNDLALQCEACGQTRPAGSHLSQALPTPPCTAAAKQPVTTCVNPKSGTNWVCKSCTVSNDAEASHCCVCCTWRYSYGVPHVSRPTI